MTDPQGKERRRRDGFLNDRNKHDPFVDGATAIVRFKDRPGRCQFARCSNKSSVIYESVWYCEEHYP